MRSPQGHVTHDDHVLVPDEAEANRLYNKGFAGTPQPGGALRLSLVEAAWLVEEQRLVVRPGPQEGGPLSFRELLERALNKEPGAQIPMFAYRDLRSRGYVVRHANKRSLDFLVWERGEAPPSAKPVSLAGAVNERAPLRLQELLAWSKEAQEEGTELVLLIVDEEGELTHYRVKDVDPRGGAPPSLEGGPVEGVFLRDRVMVWDEAAANALHASRYLGRSVPGGLQLSLVEAAALNAAGVLRCPGLLERAAEVEADIGLRARLYQDLVGRGLWVKTGYKFGSHFRVYDEHPGDSHAPWLVDVVPMGWTATWPVLSRAVRLAHSVRKRYLLGVVDEKQVRYLMVERFRP